MFKKAILFFCLITAIAACNSSAPSPEAATIEDSLGKTPATTTHTNAYVASVEKAHQKAIFLKQEAIQFDITLRFGGKERLKGTMTFTTDSGKGLLDLEGGEKIYYNGDKIFIAPDNDKIASARFSAYTWSYFFLLPYKLSDSGTVWEDYQPDTLAGATYLAQKLSFEAGTGDAPDDWYITYVNQETNLIDIAAYIVTAGGTSQEEAEVDPHAIEYTNYTTINGVPIAQDWKFWEWRTEGGLTKQLGDANLTNIRFVDLTADFFTPPNDFVAH